MWQAFEREGKGDFRCERSARGAQGGKGRPARTLLFFYVINVNLSQHTSRSGKCTLDLEKYLRDSRKDQKGLIKGEDFKLLEQTKVEPPFKGHPWDPGKCPSNRGASILNGGWAGVC